MLLKWRRQLKLLLFTKALEKEEVPEVVEVTEEVADKIEGEANRDNKGAQDTPPHPQKLAVTAIMFTETRLGTAWRPSRAHGKTK